MSAALAGFGLGLSLILAIGAQNAFVLRQGLVRQHVFAVALACALSDAVLIALGVMGIGAMIAARPELAILMRYGGAAFLIGYGALRFRAAWRGSDALQAARTAPAALRRTLATTLALTWLNPHVYLDTLVLLGSVSAQYPDRLGFGLGAVTASFVFFFGLGYGARLLAPILARPRAWVAFEIAMGLTMWAIAFGLLAL